MKNIIEVHSDDIDDSGGLPPLLSNQLEVLPKYPKSKDEKDIQEMTYNAVFEYTSTISHQVDH